MDREAVRATMTRKEKEAESAYAQKVYRERAALNRKAREVLARSQPVTLRLDREDLEMAKRQAAKKGLRYQTWIKSVLHEALRERE